MTKKIQRYGKKKGDDYGAGEKNKANAKGPMDGKKGEGDKGKKEEETVGPSDHKLEDRGPNKFKKILSHPT